MQIDWFDLPVADLMDAVHFRDMLDTWNALRDGRFAPPWRVVDLLRLPTAVIPFIAVVDVVAEPEDFVYRFWGTGHTAVKGSDLTGKSAREHRPAALGEVIFDEYRRVVAERQPLGFRHDLQPHPYCLSVFQDTLRLPLSDDGETVTHVVSFSDWRTRSKEWQQIFQRVNGTG